MTWDESRVLKEQGCPLKASWMHGDQGMTQWSDALDGSDGSHGTGGLMVEGSWDGEVEGSRSREIEVVRYQAIEVARQRGSEVARQ
jgi:hypothetical protein